MALGDGTVQVLLVGINQLVEEVVGGGGEFGGRTPIWKGRAGVHDKTPLPDN